MSFDEVCGHEKNKFDASMGQFEITDRMRNNSENSARTDSYKSDNDTRYGASSFNKYRKRQIKQLSKIFARDIVAFKTQRLNTNLLTNEGEPISN